MTSRARAGRPLSAVVLGAVLAACAVPTKVGDLQTEAQSSGGQTTGPTTGPSGESSTTAVTTDVQTSSTGGLATDTETDTDTEGTPVGPGPQRAFAIRHADLPDPDPTGGGSSAGSTTGEGIDPDALHVEVTTGQSTCEDPYGNLQCGVAWWVSFTLPPELQMPGTYDLLDLNGNFGVTGELQDAGDCSFGGGSLDGQVVIDVIDDAHVVGRFENTQAFDFDANVDFDAPICI